MRASNSFVEEVKGFEKPSIAKNKNVIKERPKTAREKIKKDAEKSEFKFPHKLGSTPKYLERRKNQSAAASKCSSLEKVDSELRPKTAADFSVNLGKVNYALEATKRIQGERKNLKLITEKGTESMKDFWHVKNFKSI